MPKGADVSGGSRIAPPRNFRPAAPRLPVLFTIFIISGYFRHNILHFNMAVTIKKN